ncbi:MAG: polyamine aminopropyltransferase [Chloroflexota bacterium]|nr:polyamine aminopropyltransferase [Chloroflexota bacterium]
MKQHRWFSDHISPDMVQMHRVTDTVYSGSTQFQSIEIIDTGAFGRCLVLDGKIQSSALDEFIYHEALVHPPMLAHPRPETALIAGGGEGATLREVLAYPSVRRVVMVDIDGEVVEVCRRFLPSFHQGSFDDSRVELRIEDVKLYLEQSDDRFDVAVIDLPEPIEEGPADTLHTREFYQLVGERLTAKGMVSLQAGAASWGMFDCFTAIVSTLKAVFPFVAPYAVHVPSFASVWGFALASSEPVLPDVAEVDRRIAARLSKPLRFYDGITHQGLFSLPRNLREAMERETRVITEGEPFFIYKP